MDQDGFTLVVGRRGGGRRATAKRKNAEPTTVKEVEEEASQPTSYQVSSLVAQIKRWTLRLGKTRVLAKLPAILSSAIGERKPPIGHVVCFGLGSLRIYRSQVQLALLLLMMRMEGGAFETDKVSYFDPMHSALDHAVLAQFGWARMEDNHMGRWKMEDGASTTLFFMPHCDRWLYSNVLECNEQVLHRMVLVGNSLRGYCDRDDITRDFVSKLGGDRAQEHALLVLNDKLRQDTAAGEEEEEEDPLVMDRTVLFESLNDLAVITFSG